MAEIHGQPAALRRAADSVGDQVVALNRVAEVRGRTAVFTAMGGSFHACYPAVVELAARGIISLHVTASELLHFRRRILDPQTVVVVVSQSGTSAEVVRLAEALLDQEPRPLVVSITNGLGNALAEYAHVALDTAAGEERGPSTMTFAGSLVTLSAVTHVLGGAAPAEAVSRTETLAEGAAEGAERLLVGSEMLAAQAGRWAAGRHTVVALGRGPARAASEMGALVLKESAGIAAEALEAGQFRHGPLELSGPDLAAIVVATEPETKRLELALTGDLVESGAAVLIVTQDGEAPPGTLSVATGRLDRSLCPAVSIIPAQLLAWALAAQHGRVPGVLTRAEKVTTRE